MLLAFAGIADLTAASMNEMVALEYWLSNVPVRLTFLFGLTSYVYLFKEGGAFGPSSTSFGKTSIGEPLQNSLVFSFGFFEIAAWFWVCFVYSSRACSLTLPQVFTSLRDERREMARKQLAKIKSEEDRL